MKKDDQFHRSKYSYADQMYDSNNPPRTEIEPQFSDADYQQAMRVDPLTTQDEIRSELNKIEEAKLERANAKLEQKKEEARLNKIEFEEFLKQKSELGTNESKKHDNPEG